MKKKYIDEEEFKREATKWLRKFSRAIGKKVKFRVNYFYFSGFVREGEVCVYFSSGDVREENWWKHILVRYCRDEEDFVGESNGFTELDSLKEKIEEMIERRVAEKLKDINSEFNFYGSEFYYKYLFLDITEGVKAVCETKRCFWFLDIVNSYQPEISERFQEWELRVFDREGVVIGKVEDREGKLRERVRQEIKFTDFDKNSRLRFWVIDKVCLLPSEY